MIDTIMCERGPRENSGCDVISHFRVIVMYCDNVIGDITYITVAYVRFRILHRLIQINNYVIAKAVCLNLTLIPTATLPSFDVYTTVRDMTTHHPCKMLAETCFSRRWGQDCTHVRPTFVG